MQATLVTVCAPQSSTALRRAVSGTDDVAAFSSAEMPGEHAKGHTGAVVQRAQHSCHSARHKGGGQAPPGAPL